MSKAQRATDKFADSNRKAYDKLVSSGAKLAGYMGDVDYTKGIGSGANRAAYDKLMGKGAKLAGYMDDVDYTAKMGHIAKKAEQAGGKTGIIGKFLFGAAAGATGGAALAGLSAAMNGALSLVNVGERAKAYSNISPQMGAGIERAQRGIDRISAAFDEFLFRSAGRLAPTIEKIADVLEVVGFVGAEALGTAADAVTSVVLECGRWLGALDETGAATLSMGDTTFAVLEAVAKTFAHVWGNIEAGAGVVAKVAGVIVDGFGQVIQVIARAAKELDRMAQQLPEAIRPEWIGKAANAIDGFGASVEKVGQGMQNWGKNAMGGVERNVKAVDKWFDGVRGRFEDTNRLMEKWEGNFLGGALTKNSTEAYSVMAKFQGGNMIADGQKRQEALLRQAVDELKDIRKKVEPLKPG